MGSRRILSDISELMDSLQELGKDCLIKEGHLIVSIGYDASNPDLERQKLEKVLASIIQGIPHPFALPRDGDYLDFVRITVETRSRRIDIELELPTVIFTDS